ncbi:hypothetical protein ACQPZX_41355 [Actinoplanes sp. CA-142083]|uniref:hypothetical protein n=1 Tax=Actinoplanes sp. CA-142083 TaxID=3239903 RepID=UPI003D8DED7B
MAKKTYHVVKIEDGRQARVTDRGMTGDQAIDKAAEFRGRRALGSSVDFRPASDSRLPGRK